MPGHESNLRRPDREASSLSNVQAAAALDLAPERMWALAAVALVQELSQYEGRGR